MSKIGIIGGGQLGLFLLRAAHKQGHQVVILDPSRDCPCAKEVEQLLLAPYEDEKAILELFTICDVVGYEFENTNVEVIKGLSLELQRKMKQSLSMLEIAQHRYKEKECFRRNGIQTVEYQLWNEDYTFTKKVVIKTCTGGYDGKGQYVIENEEDYKVFLREKEACEYIIEEFIEFQQEGSIIAIRSNHEVVLYPLFENIHKKGILDETICPGRFSESIIQEAKEVVLRLFKHEEWQGILTVEFFIKENTLIANEIAPRPHNSGHITMDLGGVSIYENTIHAWCNKKVEEVKFNKQGSMKNIIGEEIYKGKQGDHFYDYGKKEVKQGRKMAHYTVIDEKGEGNYEEKILCI